MNDKYSLKEIELLSCCLDDELSPSQKKELQARLKANPGLREKYASLQRTRSILRKTPQRKVPRNFTLTVDSSKTMLRNPPLVSLLRFSSLMAMIGLVFLMVFQLLSATSLPQAKEVSQPTDLMAAVPENQREGLPLIIQWGTPMNLLAYGIGGGGGDGSYPIISYTIPREPSEEIVSMDNPPIEPPLVAAEPPTLKSTTPEEQKPTGLELVGSQPLLGVQPPNVRGQIIFTNQTVEYSTGFETTTEKRDLEPLQKYQIVLAIIAFLSLTISFWLQPKKNHKKLH